MLTYESAHSLAYPPCIIYKVMAPEYFPAAHQRKCSYVRRLLPWTLFEKTYPVDSFSIAYEHFVEVMRLFYILFRHARLCQKLEIYVSVNSAEQYFLLSKHFLISVVILCTCSVVLCCLLNPN